MSVDAALQPQSRSLPIAQIHRPYTGQIVLGLAVAYLTLIAGGTQLLHGPNIREGGGQLTFDRALFLSASTATLTGFPQSIGFNDFKPDNALGPAILLTLTIAGSLFAMIVGALAVVRILRLPFSDKHVIVAAIAVESVAVLGGTAALFTNNVRLGDAFQQAASAVGNCGAVITAKDHYFPPFNSWLAQLVLLPLVVLGGLGLPVLMEFYSRVVGTIPRLSVHTRTVVMLTAAAYLLGTLILFIPLSVRANTLIVTPHSIFMASHPQFDPSPRGAFLAASTTAINARTAGLPFDVINYFPPPTLWVLVVMMMVGACPAGTAGGLKLTTVYVLLAGFRDALRGRPVSRTFGIAGVWVAIYLLLAGLSFICLSAIESSLSAADGMMIIISALSNVGLNRGPVMIVGPGLFLLTLVVLLGRLVPLCVLWWMARTTHDAEVVVG